MHSFSDLQQYMFNDLLLIVTLTNIENKKLGLENY